MLNNDNRVAVIAQPVQHLKQLSDVMEVQPGGGFVQDIERAAGIRFDNSLDSLMR